MLRREFAVSDELMTQRFREAVNAVHRKEELIRHSDIHEPVMRERQNPVALVYAGPNGSGKSTFQKYMEVAGIYISSDEIMKATLCTDIEAAAKSTELRTKAIRNCADFTFEMVMTTERNMRILREAKENGYFIRCIYVLTKDPKINTARIHNRLQLGGNDLAEEVIWERYIKAVRQIPKLIEVSDEIHIYDNTELPQRIYKKCGDEEGILYPNSHWDEEKILDLIRPKIWEM